MTRTAQVIVLASTACGAFGSTDGRSSAPPDAAPDARIDIGNDGGTMVDSGGDASAATDGATVLGNTIGPPCQREIACDRVVFVTRATFPANFGGRANAASSCTEAAAKSTIAAIRGRVLKPWLSDSTGTPSDSFVYGTGKYVRSDGQTVASNWAALTSGKLQTPIQTDENGDLVGGAAWTGTTGSGTLATGGTAFITCENWTSLDAQKRGVAGSTTMTSTAWSWNTSLLAACTSELHFYCVEE